MHALRCRANVIHNVETVTPHVTWSILTCRPPRLVILLPVTRGPDTKAEKLNGLNAAAARLWSLPDLGSPEARVDQSPQLSIGLTTSNSLLSMTWV
jgi:hypothetical protein